MRFWSMLGAMGLATAAFAQEQERGPGLPTSLFGTYVERGELLVYPFYEYTKTSAFEYKPSELGFTGDEDFLGRTVEQEYLLFLGYGISDRLAVELETAVHASTTFDKAANDPSAVPPRLEESGLGDVDVQLRYRWRHETEHRPEMFSFLELTPPFQDDRVLIGTHDWEAAVGFGVIRGYRWGTITGRVALAYDGEGDQFELGEFAAEYFKRIAERWRVVAALEGESDELSLIGEAQWRFTSGAMLKLNCGVGLTEKAPDVAPEVGVLFRF
ncbi:MAG TPA: hypothetical protein VJS92_10830 [Candidatus Polarisedimenticolaceae bacterium]|nr:hypothetical protein [Candidatus Polarisedimenticolaceae bacterium]